MRTYGETGDWECFIYKVTDGTDEHGRRCKILNKMKTDQEIDLGTINNPLNKDIIRVEWAKKINTQTVFDIFRGMFGGR